MDMDNLDSDSGSSDDKVEVIERAINPPSYLIMPTFAGIQQLLKDGDLPQTSEEIFCSRFVPGGDFAGVKGAAHKRLQEFTVELFGLVVDPKDEKNELRRPRGYASARICWYQSSSELVQNWRTRVFRTVPERFAPSTTNPLTPYRPSFPYLEESWQPRLRSTGIIVGLDRFLVGFSLLEQFLTTARSILLRSHTNTGRPRRFESKQQFVSQVREAYLAIWQERNHVPGQKEVAEKLACNQFTFKDYWAKDGIMPWRDLFEFWIRKEV